MKRYVAVTISVLLWGSCLGLVLAGDLRHDLLQRNEYDQAIAECTRRIAAGEGSRQDKAYSYWSRGYAYLKKGERDKALVDYGRAIDLDPTPDRYYERGELYQATWRYNEALTDFQKALELYEAPHDARDDRHDAQAARISVKTVAERGKWDTWAAAIWLCWVGYQVVKEVRRPRKILDGQSSKAPRIAFLLSVTLLPFLAVQGLNLLGWSLPFGFVVQTTLVVAAAIGACAIIFLLLGRLRDSWKQDKYRDVALAPDSPPGGGLSVQEPQDEPPGGQRRYCPHCGTATFVTDEIRFCHNCGASLEGLSAVNSSPKE